jgi:hypothetical protein
MARVVRGLLVYSQTGERAVPIFRVRVPTDDGLKTIDAIEYEGSFWLVPQWLEQPSSGLQKPMRIIRVDHIRREPWRQGGLDFVLESPVPSTLFDCRFSPPKDAGFDVQDWPPILLNADGSPSDKGITIHLPRQ